MRLRDGSEAADRRLDRLVEYDPRSRAHPVAALLRDAVLIGRRWQLPPRSEVLDQGREGACVGFGITNKLRFAPIAWRGLDAAFAREKVYWPAQRRDTYDGGEYPGAVPQEGGTSVVAGLRAATAAGYVAGYRWCFGENDLALTVATLGPVVIGVKWWTAMFAPDSSNRLRRAGRVEGGHCILVTAISAADAYYTVHNSWGPTWGRRGNAFITRRDMAALLDDDGEAAYAVAPALPA